MAYFIMRCEIPQICTDSQHQNSTTHESIVSGLFCRHLSKITFTWLISLIARFKIRVRIRQFAGRVTVLASTRLEEAGFTEE